MLYKIELCSIPDGEHRTWLQFDHTLEYMKINAVGEADATVFTDALKAVRHLKYAESIYSTPLTFVSIVKTGDVK